MTYPHPAHVPLKLYWELISNNYDGETFLAELTITNLSTEDLLDSGWGLYFNACRKTRPETVTGNVHIEHVNGDLSRLTPSANFGILKPGESRTVSYVGLLWAIQKTDAPLGFYIVYDDGTTKARAVAIGDPEIAAFAGPEQRNRKLEDVVPCVTPETRFDDNAMLTLLPVDAIGQITPTPLSTVIGHGHFIIDAETAIVHQAELASEAAFLQRSLADAGVKCKLSSHGNVGIQLRVGAVDIPGTGSNDEAYQLDVTAERISITGATPHGVLNGIQSLRQLLPLQNYREPQSTVTVPILRVLDAPRFGYRGMHLDVGRNFSSKETVLRLLDAMSLDKLNKFHFHLTDDEGWRVEISTLPELTEIGGKRGFTLDERDNLVPSFGSGAEADGLPGTGFYSKEDFIEILRFATERHIEVIPEFDVPAHARAAIKAMEVRYHRLKAQGKLKEAEEYLLTDFDDTSKYESVQLWNDNVVCIAKEACYSFIETVVYDLILMFKEAGAPFRAIQTGGDEVPEGAWMGSPICRAFMEEQGMKSIQELQNYFVGRFRDILKKNHLTVAGWEEIALTKEAVGDKHVVKPNPAFTTENFQLYVWNNVWGWGQEDIAYQLANAGYKVVLSNVTNLYFDLAYEKDPEEPGYYWGGFITTRKPFDFCPLNIYATATVDGLGHDLGTDTLDKMMRLTAQGTENILGLQGQIWGENIRSGEVLEYLAYPRIIGLAERAWAKDPGWTFITDKTLRTAKMDADWNVFANRLGQRELVRLDSLLGGYGYRVPLPGAKVQNGMLSANVEAPGLTIRYTIDGSEPTPSSDTYIGPVKARGTIKLATFTSTNRQSRTTTITL
jgi:hexosaminidase